MSKALFIAEKPSVAREFARVLGSSFSYPTWPVAFDQNLSQISDSPKNHDGYIEGSCYVVTWCVGHLVTMSYPDAYDPSLKKWSMQTLPFIPDSFRYEVIDGVKKQFGIVRGLLNRPDVTTIYVCTDSGREGEYIYRLVEQMAGVSGKERRRVWIDSQTEDEIKRGIREAKSLSAYDDLAASAYLRAKEDYLMGINFSRLLTLKYGNSVSRFLKRDKTVISVGRVMTCTLGMVVRREREIRNFVKTPFFRVIADVEGLFPAQWRAAEGSPWFGSPAIYNGTGFLKEEDARKMVASLGEPPLPAEVVLSEKKTEKKNAPLLYNLAEIQNDASKALKISPDETLKLIQELYEKKLVTYPRTDARVLSSAVAKEIGRNIGGLKGYGPAAGFAEEILGKGLHKGIGKSRYTDDSKITDHYALIPTGQGLGALNGLGDASKKIYDMIVRRFLSIFYPPAVYEKRRLELKVGNECFTASFRTLKEAGYLAVAGLPAPRKGKSDEASDSDEADVSNPALIELLSKVRKGSTLTVRSFSIKEGSTSPPKRYTSGSLILAMENAGQFIEDDELRAMIKGSGIGTSATRAEILKKLVSIGYFDLAKKTQVVTPSKLGEAVYDTVNASIPSLLNPDLTASWEKGLTMVAEGTITSDEYMQKLSGFITRRVDAVKGSS
ncbi:MAG: type IA DNA topoisomerase [Lachnospiraceae bacterium]|nr:type IA DNA topoisomerase [Lachnospiraceae bacterium]